MFRFVILVACVAGAFAAPGNLIAPVAPVLAAPAVALPVATSYHNTYRAPVLKAAPLVHAAPVAVAHPAPVAIAPAAPVLVKSAPVVAAAPVALAHAVPVTPVLKTHLSAAPLLVKHAPLTLVH